MLAILLLTAATESRGVLARGIGFDIGYPSDAWRARSQAACRGGGQPFRPSYPDSMPRRRQISSSVPSANIALKDAFPNHNGIILDNLFHRIPYITHPLAAMHPDRLASLATLFGMTPAPVASCRVLEIGCGSGGNLIPMAYRLPGSRFTGIDLAEEAIAKGRQGAAELGLANLDLRAMDLCEIGPAMGEFDYILAHGLYSWIPDHLRDRLLAACRERLAPHGVVFISFNTLPGRYVRTMLRDMMLYHARNCSNAGEYIERAREMLRMLREAHLVSTACQAMLDKEIRQLLALDDGWLFHDDLAPINDAFYVRDFVARATRHSLQYLGDAQPHLMFDNRISLDWVGGDLTEREQYLDFLSLRPFRTTLLCGGEVRLERPAGPERMDRFLFSSPARQSKGQIEGLNSICMTEVPEAVARVAAAMGAVYPQTVAFDKLLESVPDEETLRGILFTLISTGFAAFHTHGFAPVGSVGARPRANRLARWESARTGVVTYSDHSAKKVDGSVRRLIELLDGTRDFEELAGELARADGAPPLDEIRARLSPGPHSHGEFRSAGGLAALARRSGGTRAPPVAQNTRGNPVDYLRADEKWKAHRSARNSFLDTMFARKHENCAALNGCGMATQSYRRSAP